MAVSATSSFGSHGMNNARPRIVIDAMGGDHAPAEIVAGALLAAALDYADITLAGDEVQIRPLLRGAAAEGIAILHAPRNIPMDMPASHALRVAAETSLGV